jgi:hypothetical protein
VEHEGTVGAFQRRLVRRLGYQTTWDTTRGRAGATGILVKYTGGSVAAALDQAGAYSTAADNSEGRDVREVVPAAARGRIPRNHEPLERQGDA